MSTNPLTDDARLDAFEDGFHTGWNAKALHAAQAVGLAAFTSNPNPFLAAYARAVGNGEFNPADEHIMPESDPDKMCFDEDEITREIIRGDAEHAMTFPDIAAPLMSCMFTLVAPEDLANEILNEFEEQFAAEGFPYCSGATLSAAIAGILLGEVR